MCRIQPQPDACPPPSPAKSSLRSHGSDAYPGAEACRSASCSSDCTCCSNVSLTRGGASVAPLAHPGASTVIATRKEDSNNAGEDFACLQDSLPHWQHRPYVPVFSARSKFSLPSSSPQTLGGLTLPAFQALGQQPVQLDHRLLQNQGQTKGRGNKGTKTYIRAATTYLPASSPTCSLRVRSRRQRGSLLLCVAVAVLILLLVKSGPAWLLPQTTPSSSLRKTEGFGSPFPGTFQSLRSAPIARRSQTQQSSSVAVERRMTAEPTVLGNLLPELPLQTFVGQKLATAMQEGENSQSFQDLLEEEVSRITASQFADEDTSTTVFGPSVPQLESRIRQVLLAERSQTVSEIMHLKVLQQFSEKGLRPVTPLGDGQGVNSWPHQEPKALVDGIYREELVPVVSDHLQTLIGEWAHLVRDFKLTVSTFQAGQVYAVSALFGYAMRRADARFLLDKAAGTIDQDSPTLADYVANFGPEEAWSVAAVASKEAEDVLEAQVSMLFGDLLALQKELAEVVNYDSSNTDGVEEERAASRLRTALAAGEVSSLQLTVGDLRRLALEGCAFGYFLSGSEADLSANLELTVPPQDQSATGAVSALAGEVERMPKFAVFRSWSAL